MLAVSRVCSTSSRVSPARRARQMEAAVRRYTRWPAVGQTRSVKRARVASKAAVSSSGRGTTVSVPSSWTVSAPGGMARLPTGGLERCFPQASYQISAGQKTHAASRVVVFQEPAEPFTTLHRACTLCVLADRRKEQDIALALMIPLVMKMLHILRQRMAQSDASPNRISRDRHSSLTDRTQRSA